MSARATIVIVSFNARDLLRQCLATLRMHAPQYPTIVVDNASIDGSATMVEHEFPQMRLVRNDKNLGFGAACNRGLREVETDYALLLNPDTRFEADPLPRLIQTLDEYPDAAIVGCRLISSDGVTQRSARRFPSARRSLRNAIAWPYRAPSSLGDVDYVDGALMLGRTSALRAIGGFDERFFLYVEDADLCRRLHHRGWRVLYDPGVYVVHLGGGSARRGSRSDDRLRWEALAQYAAIHFGRREYASFVCARFVELLRQAIAGGLRWAVLRQAAGRQTCLSSSRYLSWHKELIGRRAAAPWAPS